VSAAAREKKNSFIQKYKKKSSTTVPKRRAIKIRLEISEREWRKEIERMGESERVVVKGVNCLDYKLFLQISHERE